MAATRIKMCGMTRVDDAVQAITAGVDALGLIFYAKSARAVNLDQAIAIAAQVPPFVTLVALFVNEPTANIERILDNVPIDLLQFHGDENAAFCQQFNRPWVKALRVKAGVDIGAACRDYAGARGILLDAWQQGVPGGTGKEFDWRLTPEKLPLPVVLAGGLHAGNVRVAMEQVHPAAVDVCSGIESAPGVKDEHEMRRFIKAVRTVEQEMEGSTHDD